jgi:hypothetical protein
MTTEDVKESMRDLSKGYVPVAVLFGIAAVIFWMGVNYGGINSGSAAAAKEIASIRAEVVGLTASLKEISSQLREVPKTPVQRSDILQLCRSLERLNKGFRCPDII